MAADMSTRHDSDTPVVFQNALFDYISQGRTDEAIETIATIVKLNPQENFTFVGDAPKTHLLLRETPLMLAVDKKNILVVRALLKSGAYPDQLHHGISLVFALCWTSNKRCFQEFLPYTNVPLHGCLVKAVLTYDVSKFELVKQLLHLGAKPYEKPTDNERNFLHRYPLSGIRVSSLAKNWCLVDLFRIFAVFSSEMPVWTLCIFVTRKFVQSQWDHSWSSQTHSLYTFTRRDFADMSTSIMLVMDVEVEVDEEMSSSSDSTELDYKAATLNIYEWYDLIANLSLMY